MTQMTELDVGDGRTTNDRTTIAAAATESYQKLFGVEPDEQDEGRAKRTMQYVNTEYDLWMLPGRCDDNMNNTSIAEGRPDDDNGDRASHGRPRAAVCFAGVSASREMIATVASLCKRRKTCASDLIVRRALFETSPEWAAATAWAVNQRLRNARPSARVQAHPSASDMHTARASEFGDSELRQGYFWHCIDVTKFQKNRPQIIQIAPVHLDPSHQCEELLEGPAEDRRIMRLRPAEATEPDRCMFGFRKCYQCSELITILGSFVETCTECSIPVCMCQVEFGRVYNSVKHKSVCEAMQNKNVPAPVIGGYIRDLQNSKAILKHGGWRTTPIQQRVGLRQGCSFSPLVFRWILEDTLAELHALWCAAGCGIDVGGGGETLCYRFWAGDMWILANCPEELEFMVN